jgi:hypothetical protein
MIERSSVKPLQFLLQPACASFKRRADLMAHQYYLGEPAASVLTNKGRLNWRPFPREISMEHGSACLLSERTLKPESPAEVMGFSEIWPYDRSRMRRG